MGIKEDIFYEGGPHRGELLLNLLIGLTIIGLPLAVGAIVRALWLRYRISNRRISITGGWMGRDKYEFIYNEIRKVVAIPRGVGLWGDMVVTLNDGSRIEMRAVPKFREVEDYINDRIASKKAERKAEKKSKA
ncbi:MAG: PH domain-containing protein [Synechococcales cyanobacterium RM1_1_8]|nr:PH domain-containing protein [Synechococcales cyanobacterium RM1_1_8]